MMQLNDDLKRKSLKALVAILGLFVVGLGAYLIFLPFYPEVQYQIMFKMKNFKIPFSNAADKTVVPAQMLPLSDNLDLGNRLIMPEIGVYIPIVDSQNGSWALNRGAWRMPQTSTPDKGSNTVIAGHRFKYLPPNNLTFYLLDKLQVGDGIVVIWDKTEYTYRVAGSQIVSPTQVSVLAPTEKPTLTLITCDPIFSQKNRLIVTAELIN